jgi:ABC-type bacteriocin/lantibiotic exporter with double-glycine peptidase domain
VLERALDRLGIRHAGRAALAGELQTSERGTSLAALERVAERRGLRAAGLLLSWEALVERTASPEAAGTPGAKRVARIALLRPGHFVLLESAGNSGARCWDPDAGPRTLTPAAWREAWTGVLLELTPRDAR